MYSLVTGSQNGVISVWDIRNMESTLQSYQRSPAAITSIQIPSSCKERCLEIRASSFDGSVFRASLGSEFEINTEYVTDGEPVYDICGDFVCNRRGKVFLY